MKRLVLALFVLLTASACGVRPTGVVPAGPGPTLPQIYPAGPGTSVPESSSPGQLILYFVSDGRVQPVIRPAGGTVSTARALEYLLAGPTGDESARGLFTLLPSGSKPPGVSVTAKSVVITVPFAVQNLPALAVDQLVCTATAALALGDTQLPAAFTLEGPDQELFAQSCQIR